MVSKFVLFYNYTEFDPHGETEELFTCVVLGWVGKYH